jgi:hypothetical protein
MTALKITFIFVPILVRILLMLNVLLAPHRPDSEKQQHMNVDILLFMDKLEHLSVFNII